MFVQSSFVPEGESSCNGFPEKIGKRGVLDFLKKIGAFTFGGGYAMVALLEREFVEDKQWLSREEFLDMVAIAESTPGPVAVNSATYVGYKIEGVEGLRHPRWRSACPRLWSST